MCAIKLLLYLVLGGATVRTAVLRKEDEKGRSEEEKREREKESRERMTIRIKSHCSIANFCKDFSLLRDARDCSSTCNYYLHLPLMTTSRGTSFEIANEALRSCQ